MGARGGQEKAIIAEPHEPEHVQITTEMVEAGRLAYQKTRPKETSEFNEDEVVQEVFRQMILVAPRISLTRSSKRI